MSRACQRPLARRSSGTKPCQGRRRRGRGHESFWRYHPRKDERSRAWLRTATNDQPSLWFVLQSLRSAAQRRRIHGRAEQVAVASGMVPYASGSDFAGCSLRTPASFCGITGIRPSNGVVATRRRSMAWSSFDVEGPMARTAADCKRLLAAMSRGDRHDPADSHSGSPSLPATRSVDLGGLRVAVSEDLGFAPMSRANRDLFRAKSPNSEACLPG